MITHNWWESRCMSLSDKEYKHFVSKYSTLHHRFIDRRCRYAFRNILTQHCIHTSIGKHIHTHHATRTQVLVPCRITLFPFEYFPVAFSFTNFRIRECWSEIIAVVCCTHVMFLFARMAAIPEQHTTHECPDVSRLARRFVKPRQPCCRGCSAPNRDASKYSSLFPPRSTTPRRDG